MSIEEKLARALYTMTRPIIPWGHKGVDAMRPKYYDQARDLIEAMRAEGLELSDGNDSRVKKG